MSTEKTLMVVVGTRPEAIKLMPVVDACRARKGLRVVVVATAQHREMLDQVLAVGNVRPDVDLNLMQPGQQPSDVTAAVLHAMSEQLRRVRPDLVVLQGDTTTTLATALAAFYTQTPIAHVEAGLRTRQKYAPFPEEMNRQLTTVLADIHFAPTERAKQNLLMEGVQQDRIHVTGNTVIDALFSVRSRIAVQEHLARPLRDTFPFVGNGRRLILVTAHRRESFGEGFEEICKGIADILDDWPDIQVVYPVHPNPSVRKAVERFLLPRQADSRIHLLNPVSYVELVYLLEHSHFVLTDSGGLQEEAPALGKPVLVMRDVTERPEAVEAGVAELVGANRARIRDAAARLLREPEHYHRMARSVFPFGDGRAAERIADVLLEHTPR